METLDLCWGKVLEGVKLLRRPWRRMPLHCLMPPCDFAMLRFLQIFYFLGAIAYWPVSLGYCKKYEYIQINNLNSHSLPDFFLIAFSNSYRVISLGNWGYISEISPHHCHGKNPKWQAMGHAFAWPPCPLFCPVCQRVTKAKWYDPKICISGSQHQTSSVPQPTGYPDT